MKLISGVDFTYERYRELLEALQLQNYNFQKVADFSERPLEKTILLRHDIDYRKRHSLQFAKIEHELGIQGSYYFRMVPGIFDKELICEIAALGHEIGYHYETMSKSGGMRSLPMNYSAESCNSYERLSRFQLFASMAVHYRGMTIRTSGNTMTIKKWALYLTLTLIWISARFFI